MIKFHLSRFVLYAILLSISFAALNCKSTRSLASQKTIYKSIYIDQFRLTYFRKILIKSYNNSNAIQEIINNDHSGFTEPVLTTDDDKLIDSLATADNEKMKIDSAEGDRRAEGAQGKRPFDSILEKLKSKWLDSLASVRYRISGKKEFYPD
jgi:hypothetical protein